MKAFKFRLQPVLDLKEQEKETLQQRYQRARENCRKRREDLLKLEDLKRSCLEGAEVDGEKEIKPRELEMQWSFIELLNLEIEKVIEDIKRLEEIARRRYLELVEKLREEKSLEKLKTRLSRDHMIEQERAQQKIIDEVGQQLFHLRQEEGVR